MKSDETTKGESVGNEEGGLGSASHVWEREKQGGKQSERRKEAQKSRGKAKYGVGCAQGLNALKFSQG